MYWLDQGWANFLHEGPDLKKTVEAAGRTLMGKQGEDLFFFLFLEIRVTNVISKKKVSTSSFISLLHSWSLYFRKSLPSVISKGKLKAFRSIHGGSLSSCKCTCDARARMKEPVGRIWPAGRGLPMSGLDSDDTKIMSKEISICMTS